MSNAGRRVVENELKQTKRQILFSIQTLDVSDSLITALFLGAARKHHFKRFPSVVQVDAFLDEVHDAEDPETVRDLHSTLVACYLSVEKDVVYDAFYTVDDGDEEDPEDEGPDEAPKSQTPRKGRKTKTD